MDSSDSSRSRSRTTILPGEFTPAFQEDLVQLPKAVRHYLAQWFFSQVRLHMVIHVSPISLQGIGVDHPRHVGYAPPVQSLGQCHLALLHKLYTLVDIDVLPQPDSQLLPGIGAEAAEDGGVIGLVAHYNAALSPAIRTLLYHTVVGWSAFTHPKPPPL